MINCDDLSCNDLSSLSLKKASNLFDAVVNQKAHFMTYSAQQSPRYYNWRGRFGVNKSDVLTIKACTYTVIGNAWNKQQLHTCETGLTFSFIQCMTSYLLCGKALLHQVS